MPVLKPAGRVLGHNLGTAVAQTGAAEWLLAAVPALVVPDSSPVAGFSEKLLALPGPLEIPGGTLGLAAPLQHPPISSLPLAPKL